MYRLKSFLPTGRGGQFRPGVATLIFGCDLSHDADLKYNFHRLLTALMCLTIVINAALFYNEA
jgi:hypothetical protein